MGFTSAREMPVGMAANYVCAECVMFEADVGLRDTGKDRDLPHIVQLMRAAMRLEGAATARSTRSTYHSGWGALRKWVRQAFKYTSMAEADRHLERVMPPRGGGSPREARESEARREKFWQQLQLFVASATVRKPQWKYNTVKGYLDGGIAAHFRSRGVPVTECPTKHWRVRQVLNGLAREGGLSGQGVERAEPMDEELLAGMVGELLAGRVPNVKGDGTMSKFEARQAAVALLVQWAGLARRSEVAGLLIGRVHDRPEGGAVVEWSGPGYRTAKTDQRALGQNSPIPEVVLGFPLGELLRGHKQELRSMGLGEKDKLFRHAAHPRMSGWADGGEAVNLMLQRVLRHTLSVVPGLVRPGRYSSHSLRRGAAQRLRDCGVSRELIKLMGRWRSDAVDVYLDGALLETRVEVARLFVGRGRSGRGGTSKGKERVGGG